MKKLKYPPILQWEVTPLCNHNCVHCYNYWRIDNEIENVKVNHCEIADKIIDNKPAAVVITGGEPLLVFEDIKESIIKMHEKGISLSINTNAVLVTEDIARFMNEYNISAFISLPCAEPNICDHITDTKDSLTRISKGIKILLNNDVRLSVNMVVSKINFEYIYYTAKYAKEELGVDSFFASRVSKPINSDLSFKEQLLSKEQINHMENELVRINKELGMRVGTAGSIPACSINSQEVFDMCAYRRTCTAGRISYAVDTMGNIKACPRDVKIYGNILTDDFFKVWDSMEEWRDGSLLPKECKECSVKTFCNGGCRLDALPLTGKRDSLDPIADITALPIKFQRKIEQCITSEDEILAIPPIIMFVKEDFGWRASVGPSTMYVTEEMKEFLGEKSKFTVKDFMIKYDIEFDIAKNIFNSLIRNNIIYVVSKK